MKHVATPIRKEVTETGEVFITDAKGARLFKGEGNTKDGAIADDIVRVYNAYGEEK